MQVTEGKLLTVAELMELTGYQRSTIYEFFNRSDAHRLPARRIGTKGDRRVLWSDYLDWCNRLPEAN